MVESKHWTTFHARLHQRLRQNSSLLPPQQSILMAVSGGQDSLAMAQLLIDLQPKWHWRLGIAHCNHRWHSREDEAATQVQQLAQEQGVAFWLRLANQLPQTEEAARHWRYDSLAAIAREEGFTTIVTGHTASDRAETLLYNLARGSGLDGLAALSWQRSLANSPNHPEESCTSPLRLVRPLLGFTRQETGEICQSLALPVWEDPVNEDLSYRRNRMRHQVLPLLIEQINPRAIEHLAQTAELLEAEVQYLEAQAQALRQQTEANRALNRLHLRQAPLALQRRVVRQFLQQWLPKQPNAAQIDKVVDLLSGPRGAQSDPFPGGSIARVEGDWVKLG